MLCCGNAPGARSTAGSLGLMADLTQREVAARMKPQQSFVSAVESGQHRVSMVELMDFAEAIGFDPRSALRRMANVAKR
jgi:hypothetical protein